ncbi:MAG: hypothetical protein ACYCW6_06560 [Candidatus Xenobia bacterium]
MPANATTFQQPQYRTRLFIQGIMSRNLPQKISETSAMLKNADQAIDDVQILSHNGYGAPMSADIVHHTSFPVSPKVLAAAQRTSVTISPWFTDSCGTINNTVNMLKGCDMKIINVDNLQYNGYGKILGASIEYIPSARYDTLMAPPASQPPAAPVPPSPATTATK